MAQEQKIRQLLYTSRDWLRPAFNPEEPCGANVVDATYDISNHTRIYHEKTNEVREFLKDKFVVTDTPQLAGVLGEFAKKATSAPFGHTTARDIEGPFTVGLLNHDDDYQMANEWGGLILKRMDRTLLVYGKKLDLDFEQEVTEDFDDFAGRCDVLLLPGIPQTLTSVTLPLSVMMATTAVLASPGGSWYTLNAAAGVYLMSNDRKDWQAWKGFVGALERQPRKLALMKERNLYFTRSINAQSMRIIENVARRLAPQD